MPTSLRRRRSLLLLRRRVRKSDLPVNEGSNCVLSEALGPVFTRDFDAELTRPFEVMDVIETALAHDLPVDVDREGGPVAVRLRSSLIEPRLELAERHGHDWTDGALRGRLSRHSSRGGRAGWEGAAERPLP